MLDMNDDNKQIIIFLFNNFDEYLFEDWQEQAKDILTEKQINLLKKTVGWIE